MTLNQNEVTVS